MGVRKNILYMSQQERNGFFEALLRMKAHIVNPMAPAQDQYSVYDQFVSLHWAVFRVSVGDQFTNRGHQGPAFLSWHREYLIRFEKALQAEVPGVTLPYWDWSPSVFVNALMGPNGGPNGAGGGEVLTGYFAYDRPGTPNTANAGLALPAWWPMNLPGWRIRADLDDGPVGVRLERNFQVGGPDVLPTQGGVDVILQQPTPPDFRRVLEAGVNVMGVDVASSHNEVHRYIDGHMNTAASPNDPIFWLHHCNLDRLWAMWQLDGHLGAAWFPVSATAGHALNHAMWPWVGNAAYVLGNSVPAYYIPSFSNEPARLNQDVLDHRGLGYAYDTEPVLGLALDRSFSMTGMTSDPFAGMGAQTSKWNLAKLGVKHLLDDCEAAYAAREAYVTSGVQTFTTAGIGNVVDPVIPNKPYGLVRSGANFAEAYPEADVTNALNGLQPQGATPLAAALLETHAEVVRPAQNAMPPDDVRYLSILTDGKETAAPFLNTLAAGHFADTVIFGMGFGAGNAWDGVDYATIQTIVTKGRTPPALSQVFTGENMGAIDKFYSNTVARAIGYTPMMDPRFEMFPGEEVHLPIWVTSADDSLMITLLRGDSDARHWHVMLISPDGVRFHDSTKSPYFITFRRNGHRDTIFVRRNGLDPACWAGRWSLHVAYGMGHGHEGRAMPKVDFGGGMLMPSRWDLMIPAGAPPTIGPVFAQFDAAKGKRVSPRTLSASGKFATLGGPVVPDELPKHIPQGPSVVVINVFTRSTLNIRLRPRDLRFAGEPLVLHLEIDDALGGSVSQTRVLARLIAPARPVGAAFLDKETIPIERRKKYLMKGLDGERFDELRFLADYEKLKPGAFALRDESLVFRAVDGQNFRAEVSKTEVAGVYRSGAFVEGTLTRPGGAPERFVRVLSTESSLGVSIDARSSRPTLHWLEPDHFVVTVTPRDRFGNLLSPAGSISPVLQLLGSEIKAMHENLLDGSHRFHVRLQGKGVRPEKHGRSLATHGQCEGVTGDCEVKAGQTLELWIRFGHQTTPVMLPALIGHGPTCCAFGPGSREAMQLPLEERVSFESSAEARAAGHKIQKGHEPGHEH